MREGLLSALADIAATLLASGKTRLELFSNEIETARQRAIQLMFLALALAFCFGLGLVLAVLLLAALFWEQRLAVLAVCAFAFFALGGVLLVRFRREVRDPEKIFAASAEELELDLRHLRAGTRNEPPDR